MDELRNRKGTNFPIFGVVSFDVTLADGTVKHTEPDGGIIWASPVEETPQEHYEGRRRNISRCPKCGSDDTSPEDWWWNVDDGNGGDEYPIGINCGECGYENDDVHIIHDATYIAPGDPGSHDKPEDYEPWEDE